MGFSTPLVKEVPTINQFQTDGFADLQRWFKEYDKSTMINIHLIEPLLTRSNASVHFCPYILATYGTNNRFKAINVLRRWFFLYNKCKDQDNHLVGFATDCDSRYLKAMRLSLGVFAQLSNFDLSNENNEMFDIDYPQS